MEIATITTSEFETICQQLQQRALPPEKLQVEPERVRQAAVTVLLREHFSQPEILMIKRADHPSDPWSGHLALPGGRADLEDGNLLKTAAREMHEEVGIELADETLFIGRLQNLRPKNPHLPVIEITPWIALAPREITLELSDEVAEAFWLPVQALQTTGQSEVFRFPYQNSVIKYPAYPSPHGPIWGITKNILEEFLSLLN